MLINQSRLHDKFWPIMVFPLWRSRWEEKKQSYDDVMSALCNTQCKRMMSRNKGSKANSSGVQARCKRWLLIKEEGWLEAVSVGSYHATGGDLSP